MYSSWIIKKSMSMFLTLVLMLSLMAGISLPVKAETYSGTCGDNVTWELDTETGVLTISGNGEMEDYSSISSIPWYSYRSYVTSVKIEDGVTSIGRDAFYGCTSLTSATIGDSVTSIGMSAFYNCNSLKNITIPDSVTSIGDSAFEYCSELTSITIGNSVKSIGFYAFNNTAYYKDETNWEDDVLYIDNYLIDADTYIEKCTVKDGTTIIADATFQDCSNLTEIIIPDSITSIGENAFYQCESLKSITIGNRVTSIGKYAFYQCESLKSVTILNADCEIYDSSLTISDTATIYGYTNSTAQTYAEKYDRKFDALDATTTHTHIYDSGIVTTAATCTTDGEITYTCSECGDTYTELIPATGHSYETTTTKATTSKAGKIVKKCSVCGATVSTTTIAKIKSVTLSTTSYTYNGKVKKPSVTVKDSNGKTISSKYYTVTYASGRKKVGTYKVTVKFKGNYSGTVTKTFTIKPKATSISKLTAKSKGFKVTWKKISSQATGYQIQYATNSKFTKNKVTKTVTSYKTTSKTITKLKAKKKYYVRVRTYKTVNGKKYYSAWSKAKTVTTKK